MKKSRSKRSLEGVLIGLVLALSACTEAHDVDAILGPPVFDGEAGGGGDGDGDGDGVPGDGDGDGDGLPGDGDGDGLPGDGDGDAPSNCDNCAPSDVGGQFGVTPCCTQDNKCGLDVGAIFGGGSTCLEQDAPGTPSADCPAFSFMGSFTLDGCCRPDGTCGVNDTFLGLGCTENPDGNGERCQPRRGGGTRGPQ